MNRPKQVALFDGNGFFVGLDSDHGGPQPHNSTSSLPEVVAGFAPHWNGKKWNQIEDHRGKSGFVNGQSVTVDAPGPYPAGWSDAYVDPRPAEEIRREEILKRLDAIDGKRVRPMAKILVGGDAEEERRILAGLEAEAAQLREALAGMA